MPDIQTIGQNVWAGVTKRARYFRETAEALAKEPTAFFVRYFVWAGTRFSDKPAEERREAFPYLEPFTFLGYAILISALVHPLTQLVVLDIARQNAHMFQPGFVNFLESMGDIDPARQAARMVALYIDFGALTGIPVLDTVIGDWVQYGVYVLFATLMWRIAPEALTVKAVAHSFAYLVAFVVAAQAAVDLLTGILHLIVGLGLQGFMFIGFLSSLAFGAYILAVPCFALPAVLNVERPVVIKATLWAFGIWTVGGIILDLVLTSSGIWIRNFNLHLGL